MPYITIKLVEGRSREKKELLVKKVTEAACDSLGVEPSSVRIELVELPEGTFAVAGKLVSKSDL